MAVNDKILVTDYNNIRNKVVGILGTGSANSGYGQTIRSSAVGLSTKVGVNDWANLYYDLYNAYYHQNAPSALVFSIAENDIVKYGAYPNNQYDGFADLIVANKFVLAASQSATRNKGSGSQTWPGPYGSYWTSLAQCIITVTFSSASTARYFFNSGGAIRFSTSRSGGTSSSQNTSWTNLLNSVNAINGGTGPRFGGNYPGTGIEPNDGQNYYRLSNGWAAWYTASASSPYGSNYFRIFARSPNVGDNSGGTDREVQFLIYWADDYVDPGNASTDSPNTIDKIDGTLTISVSTLFATGTLLPAGAGSFTVEDPTVTIGVISS